MVNGGIFGPKLCGKTTLARHLSEKYWREKKIATLVLDINPDEHHLWKRQALIFTDETKFWETVKRQQNFLVIVDEAAATIRRDRTLIPMFTRLRHQNHKLLVIGHNGVDLLPTMRQQLDTVYLFRQPEESAKIWATTFCQPELLKTTELNQYEFIVCQSFQRPYKTRLSAPKKKNNLTFVSAIVLKSG